MEYLVYQLLLASMHTLCVVIQPEAHAIHLQHHGSWRYWLQFLAALGDRRTKSMVLASSRLDPPAAFFLPPKRAPPPSLLPCWAKLGEELGEAPARLTTGQA